MGSELCDYRGVDYIVVEEPNGCCRDDNLDAIENYDLCTPKTNTMQSSRKKRRAPLPPIQTPLTEQKIITDSNELPVDETLVDLPLVNETPEPENNSKNNNINDTFESTSECSNDNCDDVKHISQDNLSVQTRRRDYLHNNERDSSVYYTKTLPREPMKATHKKVFGKLCSQVNLKSKAFLCKTFLIFLLILTGVILGFIIYLLANMKSSDAFILIGGNDGMRNQSIEVITDKGVCKPGAIPDLPEGRKAGASAVLNLNMKHIYPDDYGIFSMEKEVLVYCGGIDNQGGIQKTCFAYLFEERLWKRFPSLLWETAYPAYQTIQGKFLIAGGLNKQTFDRVQIFSNGKWVEVSKMAFPRAGACGVGMLGYFITIGGGTNTVFSGQTYTTIQVYSLKYDQWKVLKVPSSFHGMNNGGCIQLHKTRNILLVGGTTDRLVNIIAFQKGGSVTHKALKSKAPISHLPQVGEINGGKIIVAGGRHNSSISSSIWILDEDKNLSYFDELNKSRELSSSVVVQGGSKFLQDYCF